MDRIKLAVWGINNAIWNVIKKSIDMGKTEIVLFIDGDEEKQGIYYENIPVIAPLRELLDRVEVDVYLIAALSAYESIRRQLMEWGRTAEQIQPFITNDICKYCLGTLDEIERNFIKEAYFEPEKIEKLVDRYREKYPVYRKNQYQGDAAWVNRGTLISHACGGIVDGRKVMYTNSKEAFAYTVKSKFRLMECDVMRMKNGQLILGHDFWMFYDTEEKGYTVMSMEDLLKGLHKYSEITCLVDVKWWQDTYMDYRDVYKEVMNGIERMISCIAKEEKERADLKSRIVMEVYDEETIKLAKQGDFQMAFTQYRNPEWMDYLGIVNLCCQYGIGAVIVELDHNNNVDKRLIDICRKKGIKVFVYPTNCLGEYSRLRKLGVAGVMTDYLRPMEM